MWKYLLTPLVMSLIAFSVFPAINSDFRNAKESQAFFKEKKISSLNLMQQQQSSLEQVTSLPNTYDQEIYQGTWTGGAGIKQFNFFNGETGIILTEMTYSDNNYDTLYMVLLDPQYDDEKKTFITVTNLENCVAGLNFIWQCQTTIQAQTYYKRSLQSTMNIMVQFSMNAENADGGQTALTAQNTQFNLSIVNVANSSIKVNLSGVLTYQDSNFGLYAILYNLFISAFGFQQVLSMVYLTKFLQETNEIYSTKLSMLTVGFITIYDAYVSLAHLYMALEYTDYFYYFLLPTLIYFILTTILDMKLLIIIWKNRCYVHFSTPQEVRKGFAVFYAKFYMSLIVFFTLTYFFYLYNAYVLILPIFIVPQIVHNYMKGNQPLFIYNYAIGSILSRAILPIYYRGCPDNIRNLAPSLSFSIIFPLLFVLFILIMFLQHKIGPRFFVPRRFKGGFDYYKTHSTAEALMVRQKDEIRNFVLLFPGFFQRKIFLILFLALLFITSIHPAKFFIVSFKKQDDCPICMTKLSEEPDDDDELEQHSDGTNDEVNSNVQQKLVKKKKIIVTPCNHLYHVSCFRAWINVKLECPSCRNVLLPLID